MQHREHHRGEDLIANTKRDIAAAIVFYDLRIHVLAAEVRRRIDMRNKTNGRNITLNVSRQGAHDRPFLTQRHIHQSHFLQLRLKQT